MDPANDDDGKNFKDHPTVLSDYRPYPHQQTPREALVVLLQQIDEGRVKPECLVVAMRVEFDDGGTGFVYRESSPNPETSLGLLERTKHAIHDDLTRYTSEK